MKLFLENVPEILVVQGAPLSIFAKFYPSLCNFILSLYYVKKFQKTYISTFICHLYPVKEARPKRKHRKRYKEEKSRRSVLGKINFPVLFALGLGLITPYSLGVLI